MDYIKIPLGSWNDSEIVSIKNKCNAEYGANFTDEDIITISIDLLKWVIMINNNEFAEDRINRHINRILEIATDKEAFGKYLNDAVESCKVAEIVSPVFNDISKGDF